MQWFFYKSGQFFVKRNIEEEWKKDWHKLVRPFIVWSTIGYALYVTFLGLNGELTFCNAIYAVVRSLFLNGSVQGNNSLWFLLTLFGVKQIANIILPKEDDVYYWQKCIIIIFLAYIFAFGLYYLHIPYIPRWIANGAVGLSFFTMGYCLHKSETKLWLLIPCIIGYICCCIWGYPDVDMYSNSCDSVTKYLLNMPGSLAGIVTFNMLCRLVSKYFYYITLPFEYVGKYAMIIYVSHALLFGGVRYTLVSFELTQFMSFNDSLLIILCTYIIFLPVFCYLYKMQRNFTQKSIHNL